MNWKAHMVSSNTKTFTAIIYLGLLVLIAGSTIFLIVLGVQQTRQAQAYTNQIIERINNSYIANGNFTSTTFTEEVKDLMQGFGDLIKVITIVDSQNVMQNRFRFGSIDPGKDPNPNWQHELRYTYNPLLYQEGSYPLELPGQGSATIKVLYQQLPFQMFKNVLRFNTLVVFALLLLSFLAFFILPKRDPVDTTWSAKSMVEEDQELEEDPGHFFNTKSAWLSQDFPEANGEDNDNFEPNSTSKSSSLILGSESNEDSTVHKEVYDPWGNDEDVDLSFNDQISDEGDTSEYSQEDVLNTQPSADREQDIFTVELEGESSSPISIDTIDLSDEYRDPEEIDMGDEIINDLDEGLGNDVLEAEPTIGLEEKTWEQPADLRESDEKSEPAQFFASPLNEEERQAALSWLENFLEAQKVDQETEENMPGLLTALLETNEDDIEIVRDTLEHDLLSQASILPNNKGMLIFFSCEDIQNGIEELQSAVSTLPGSYLKNLKMGITGVSTARSNAEPSTVLSEVEYALSSCDETNNISIFDANDRIFNQQHSEQV